MPVGDMGYQIRCPEQGRALAEAQAFIADLEQGQTRWLSLLGPSGRGKTHLARGIEAWRKSKSPGKFFYKWLDLLQTFRSDRGEISRFMARCNGARLMIIDDIGAGYETEFAASVIAEIAERRLGKATVLTANLNLEQVAGIDSRIASRMLRGGNEIFTFQSTPDFGLGNDPEQRP